MTALLCLAALSLPPERVADLEFARVQEEWVGGLPHPARLEGRLHPWVRDLGAARFFIREDAELLLGMAPEAYLPDLAAAAAWHRDQEVRLRAARLLRKAFACDACGGTGRCRRCEGLKPDDPPCGACVRSTCNDCGGSGDARLELDHYEYVAGPAGYADVAVYRHKTLFSWPPP